MTNAATSRGAAIRIASLRCLDPFVVRVRWKSGRTFNVDLSSLLSRVKGLRVLRTPAGFAQAAVSEGGHSIAWPGDIDIGADRLWELCLEQNGRQDAVEFLRWRWRHGLSLSAAADALGLSRRQVAYYASGGHRVPRTVLLACKGWELERPAAVA